jgi:hypothetical protein
MGGDADAAETALRASGSRITRAARTILDEVIGSDDHGDRGTISDASGVEEDGEPTKV